MTGAGRAGLAPDLRDRVRSAAGDPSAALALAAEVAAVVPAPGLGRTLTGWRRLAEVATIDLTVARTLEPHLDALAILGQAVEAGYAVPVPTEGSTWGVYAAEGPGARLEAREQPSPGASWNLTGRKPWCSLAGLVDRALVTAWISEERHGLFALDLRDPGVRPVDEPWVSRGLAAVPSTGLDLTDVPAEAVGPPGWYLSRPGFAWGGLGVAACWLGGAAGLARRMLAQARSRKPDQLALAMLGEVDAAVSAAWAALAAAAAEVDQGGYSGPEAWPRMVRVRHAVYLACELTLGAALEGLGPAPLTGEEEHARRVADLQVYLRQHKGLRDAAVLGRSLVDGLDAPWT